MDKGLFASDGSFMERFKQMQQEKEKAAAAAAAAASSPEAPKHANPKPGFAVAANKRPFELNKAGPVATGGKLAFSLKKAKVAVAPVFAADDDDEDVEREEPAKRQKSAQADTPVVAGPAGVVGNHLLIHLVLLFSTCVVVFPFLVFIGVLWFVLCCCHQMIRYKNVSHQSNDYIQICDGTFSSIIVLEHHSTKLAHFSLLI